MILLDSNVYIALFVGDHPLHPRAVEAYGTAQEKKTACNAVILSEVHHILRPRVGAEEAGRRIRSVLAADELLPLEASAVERALDLVERPGLSTNDALIAAHALEAGMELLTFDADFRRVAGLRLFRG